jgi:hypothetical protein
MLSMYTATLGFIEILLVGVAIKRPRETFASLKALNEARERLAGTLVNLPVSTASRSRRPKRAPSRTAYLRVTTAIEETR